MNNSYVFDVEVLPNFFSVIFKNTVTKENISFVKWEDINQIDELISFIKSVNFMVGYNTTNYDNIILNYIIETHNTGYPVLNNELYKLSKNIIAAQKTELPDHIRELKYRKYFKSIDLMRILFPDKLKRGLKSVAVNIKSESILDSPINFDEVIYDEAEVASLLDYNLNDVTITLDLLYYLRNEIELRNEISKEYKVNVLSESDTGVAKKILTKLYTEASGLSYQELSSLRTHRDFDKLKVSDILLYDFEFNTPEIKQFYEELKTQKLSVLKTNEKSKGKRKLNKFNHLCLDGVQIDYGLGGIHGFYKKPTIIEEDDNFVIIDIDFRSFYPEIIANNEICPAHLDKSIFIPLFKRMINDRLLAKKNGQKTKAEGLKISINSVFGLFRSMYFWLKDDACAFKTTVNGQLIITKLLDILYSNGFHVFYLNTDGLTAKIHKSKLSHFYQLCKDFESFINIELEYTEYEKCIIRDVNNYIIKPKGKEAKEKGLFVVNNSLKKGYNYPIIPLTLKEYFINNIPVEKTIEKCDDIHMFFKSVKVGNNFTTEYRYLNDKKTIEIKSMQKNNRWYVSKSLGYLVKIEKAKIKESSEVLDLFGNKTTVSSKSKEIAIEKDQKVCVLNKIEHTEFHLSNVDRSYYSNQCRKIIEFIEDSQIKLFT